MDEDIVFADSQKTKDKNAKQGRRAKKEKLQVTDSSLNFDDDSEIPMPSSKETSNLNKDAPPKPKKTIGGWGDDKRSQKQISIEEDERLRPQTPKDDSDDDDIPVIPELEDSTEPSSEVEVAVAPNVIVNRVATFKELDNDLIKHASFLTLDDEIDLKLLCQSLYTDSEVHELDEIWEWERLFTDVSSELLKEWETDT